MTFIVILIALLIERFFDWSHLRHWYWYTAYQRVVWKRFPLHSAYNSYLVLAVTIIPLLIIVGLIQFLIHGWLYGFINLLFGLLVLLYCLGPQNLWADAFSCLNALTQGDVHYAAEKLKTSFGITDIRYSQSLHRHFLNHIFIEAERRVFAVIFWFVLIGPVGAILYRAVTFSAEELSTHEVIPELSQAARNIEGVLDWVPIRIFTFIFAIGGHFVQVFACWRDKFLLGINSNEVLLTECGVAALGIENKIPEDGSAEKHSISLIDRSFVIMLIAIALIVFLV